MIELDTVHCLDCFDLLAQCDDQSVDAIICDLPYGTTACAWDSVIPFEPLWAAFKRVIKPRGAIVLTASQPFTSALVMSNAVGFKYSYAWVKNKVTGFANAKKQPLRRFEDVLVFNTNTYYPQGITKAGVVRKNGKSVGGTSLRGSIESTSGKGSLRTQGASYMQEFTDYPDNVLVVDCETSTQHGTQKPVALFAYLIRTYTRPGELVLDPTCGSGTTAIAARNEGRRFICGDSDPGYVQIARDRLAQPYTVPMFACVPTEEPPTQTNFLD